MTFFNFKRKKANPNQVKFLREERTLSAKELAKLVEELHLKKFKRKIHVSWQTIVVIERYRYHPSYGLALLISEVLGEKAENVFFYI